MKNPLTPEWLATPADANLLERQIWPRTAERSNRGELSVGQVPVSDLVRQYGSPLYVVDQEDFESRLMAAQRAFNDAARAIGSSAKVYYASKALLTTEEAVFFKRLTE